jgi:hypothetical protein
MAALWLKNCADQIFSINVFKITETKNSVLGDDAEINREFCPYTENKLGENAFRDHYLEIA